MTSTEVLVDAQDALATLRGAVDLLLEADLGTPDDDALLDLLREFEVQRRRLAAVDVGIVGEIEARSIAHSKGVRSTVTLVSLLLRVDPAEAKGQVIAAQNLTGRTTLIGERLAPIFPAVAHALPAGEIGSAHARVITTTVDALPLDVQAAKDREIEEQLVGDAKRFAPRDLQVIARRLLYTYDQDGQLARDAERARLRSLEYRRHADGSATGTFRLDPTTAEAFETVMDSQLGNMSAEERGHRSATQLRHDTFRDLMLLLIRTDRLPATSGVTTTMVVTLTAEQYASLYAPPPECPDRGTPNQARAPGDQLAVTGHNALITLDEVAPLLGDARVFPVALGRMRRVEAYGDKHRIFTEKQRLVLAARDRGCSFPGCTAVPARCEAHHVRDAADGGPTSVDNGTLLCPYHHRMFERLGYRCVMLDGAPHWIAPAWIDPTQTPTRNTAHDPSAQ